MTIPGVPPTARRTRADRRRTVTASGGSVVGPARGARAPAGSGRGEHDRRPVTGAPDRPEPVGAGVPGVVSRVWAAGSAAARVRGPDTGMSGRGAGPRGSVRLTMPTRGRVGWSGRFGVGRSVVRSRAVPGGDPVRTPGRAGSRGPRPVRGHGRRACGTAGGRGSSRCPRRGRARGRSGRCSCPGSSRAAPGARAR